MAEFDYDLFVIGAGSGGVRAARLAAQSGAKVAVAEESRYGGTCVIRGCVPKKLMVYASGFHEAFEDAAGFGWTVGEPTFDGRNSARREMPRWIVSKTSISTTLSKGTVSKLSLIHI